jgi:peptidoglycan/xylan/chitin deacetylase (PgdA/CDA1 family)
VRRPTLRAAVLLAALAVPAALSPQAPSAAPGPLFTWVFDDGFSTDAVVAAEFAARGAVACSAVTTDWIGTANRLSVEDIRGLQGMGWEILSHTRTHPHLTLLDPARVEDELKGSREALEALGVRVRSLVYPYNQANPAVEGIARGLYRSARGGGRAFNTGATRASALRSYPFVHDGKLMREIVDSAAAERAWLIVYHHRVDVAVSLRDRWGSFLPDEELDFSPSGCIAVCQNAAWSQWFQTLHFMPLTGTPRAGDLITGCRSGASAKVDRVLFDDFAVIAGLLDYLRDAHPEVRIVTVDQALDLLGFP